MPSRQVTVGIVVAVALAVVVAIAGLVLTRDDVRPVRGDVIAYSCREPGNAWYAICVMKTDGSEKRRVTSRLTTTDPAWSPDGRRIAFTRNEEVGEYTTFADDDVFVMDADGDDSRQLTLERDGQQAGQPTWSGDGREIAFVRGTSVPSSTIGRPGDLFVIGADGTGARRVTRGGLDSGPSWSPDGREIAFSRATGFRSVGVNSDIYVVGASGGTPRRLTRTPNFLETAPAWSPDGTRIAFARSTVRSLYDGKAAIYVMNRDGSGLRLVLAHEHFARNPLGLTWSPDGRTIAFETSPAFGCTAIAVVGVEGGSPRQLTSCTGSRGSALAPAWQPAVDDGEAG